MTTREMLLERAREWKKYNPMSKEPQFIIYTLDFPYSTSTYYDPWQGKTVTYPSPGCVEDASFYGVPRDLDDAIEFLNQNKCGLDDGCFSGAFILMKVPDIAPFNTPETRMFFRWNDKKQGFFQEEEPEHFNGFPIIEGLSMKRNYC